VILEPDDLVEEPDMFETYEQTIRFLQRQTALSNLLQQPGVNLQLRAMQRARAQSPSTPAADRSPICQQHSGFSCSPAQAHC
jgi:hypothetical protein